MRLPWVYHAMEMRIMCLNHTCAHAQSHARASIPVSRLVAVNACKPVMDDSIWPGLLPSM